MAAWARTPAYGALVCWHARSRGDAGGALHCIYALTHFFCKPEHQLLSGSSSLVCPIIHIPMCFWFYFCFTISSLFAHENPLSFSVILCVRRNWCQQWKQIQKVLPLCFIYTASYSVWFDFTINIFSFLPLCHAKKGDTERDGMIMFL